MLIIWDYFGVIAQDHFWYTAERLAEGHGMKIDIKDAQHQSDLGLISWDDYCRAVANDIDVPLAEVMERYQHHQINRSVISLIGQLSNHQHVILSNASHEYLLPIIDRLGLGKVFSNVFVSSQIGYAKPDPRAFEHVLHALNMLPENAVMVDDSMSNVVAAQNYGMKGMLYERSDAFEEDLRQLVI